MEAPETRYTTAGGVHIAYQVVGDGPIDAILVSGRINAIDAMWTLPPIARSLERVTSFARLICFDKRGCGASDNVPSEGLPALEAWTDDIRTVLDAAESPRAAVVGLGGGSPVAIMFAASYPARCTALVLIDPYVRFLLDDEASPRAGAAARLTEEARLEEALAHLLLDWGTGRSLPLLAPSLDDPRMRLHLARLERASSSPGTLVALERMQWDTDIRPVVGAVAVPTLVIHRTDDRFSPVEQGRYLARTIRNARYVELPGEDHVAWAGDSERIMEAIEEFLTGHPPTREPDRVLATVLFTDFVDSTQTNATLGDRRWRDLLDAHDEIVSLELDRHRGRQVKATGDGVLATFDGPARAIRCAQAIRDQVQALGIGIRAGLHTGEIELRSGDVAGLAVVIGRRVCELATKGEVLASSTVKDLVAGSGIAFEERGPHELKGVPDTWRIFAVES